jgi:SRSO17 transposase
MNLKIKMKIEFENLKDLISEVTYETRSCFGRSEVFSNACQYIHGLLSSVERKNSWQIAERIGHETPYRSQNLINRATWNESKLLKYIQIKAIKELGTEGSVAIIDDTGFIKKGEDSAGVQRQYTGTAGGIANSQIGTFLAWRTNKGHTLIDRMLYMPEDWISDTDRCEKAGVPDKLPFRTKNEQAIMMYKEMLANGNKPEWMAADEAYGRDHKFRNALEEHDQPYVLIVPKDHSVRIGLQRLDAEYWKDQVKETDWKRQSCGEEARESVCTIGV